MKENDDQFVPLLKLYRHMCIPRRKETCTVYPVFPPVFVCPSDVIVACHIPSFRPRTSPLEQIRDP